MMEAMASPTPTNRRGPGPRQQQRSAETRDAVVAAAVELLRAGGTDAVTAAALSERSGVSWGGIQHQFGSKDGVLDATLARLVADLAGVWQDAPSPGGDLETRVRALVDLVWDTVRHPSYLPLMALLRRRAAASARAGEDLDAAVLRLRFGTTGLTRRLFGDLDLDQSALDLVDSFCFAALGGVADQLTLTPAPEAIAASSRDLVVVAVLHALAQA